MIQQPNSPIRILRPVSELNYYDTQSATMCRTISPLDAWNAIMDHPQPVLKLAFKIRDAISARFGVKSIGGFSGQKAQQVAIGDQLDFFLVEYVDPDCLVLTERDRHLDVMTCISVSGHDLSITSSVQVHNWFGHAYMIPVGIAHKWIVRRMMKRLQRNLMDPAYLS